MAAANGGINVRGTGGGGGGDDSEEEEADETLLGF
jgi:hypothetical protein